MTPTEYLNHIQQLARARDMVGIIAFEKEHLTDALLDTMTPQERRLAYSANHVAARFVGEGSLDPPTGIPIDDLEDDELAEATADDSAAPVRTA